MIIENNDATIFPPVPAFILTVQVLLSIPELGDLAPNVPWELYPFVQKELEMRERMTQQFKNDAN